MPDDDKMTFRPVPPPAPSGAPAPEEAATPVTEQPQVEWDPAPWIAAAAEAQPAAAPMVEPDPLPVSSFAEQLDAPAEPALAAEPTSLDDTVASREATPAVQPEEPALRPARPRRREAPAPADEPAGTEAGSSEAPADVPPAKKAAAKKAPAKTAAAKKVPAEKAPVKKAPAKKAAANKAPAKKAPVKKAPAAKAVAATAPERLTPAKKAPAKKALATPVGKRPDVSMPQAVDVVPGMRLAPAASSRESRRPRWARFLVALSVLLISGAAGLGAAAVVLMGKQTWEAHSAVRLTAPQAPTTDPVAALRSALGRYTAAVPTATSSAESATGVPAEDVRGDLEGTPRGTDTIVVTAKTANKGQARAFAVAGADGLIATVSDDQRSVRQGDQIVAVLADSASQPEKTSPSTAKAGAAGGVAAGAVFVLGLLITLRPRRQE